MEISKMANVKKFGKKLTSSLNKTQNFKDKFDAEHGIWRGENFVHEVELFE